MLKKYFYRLLILMIFVLSVVAIYFTHSVSDEPVGLKFSYEVAGESRFVIPRAYISGAVNNPGVYKITLDMRVEELVLQAGGFTSNADVMFVTSSLNLAELIADGQHIFIPEGTNAITGHSPLTNSKQISINSASISELISIPGIGESTAQRIIDARPYVQISDLKNVSGIGDSKYTQFLEYISL